MEDFGIIELYIAGDGRAIEETQIAYGRDLMNIALRITGSHDDALECVNDALLQAWKTVAEVRPTNLRAYLVRITRNISLDCQRRKKRLKRSAVSVALSELEDCLPGKNDLFVELDEKELTKEIENWLLTVGKDKRVVFISRYFKMESTKDIAKSLGVGEGSVRMTLSRLRTSLKKYLEDKGYNI